MTRRAAGPPARFKVRDPVYVFCFCHTLHRPDCFIRLGVVRDRFRWANGVNAYNVRDPITDDHFGQWSEPHIAATREEAVVRLRQLGIEKIAEDLTTAAGIMDCFREVTGEDLLA